MKDIMFKTRSYRLQFYALSCCLKNIVCQKRFAEEVLFFCQFLEIFFVLESLSLQ